MEWPAAQSLSHKRYEWKYLDQVDHLGFCLQDYHQNLQPEFLRPYKVLNLYFDTRCLRSFYGKLDGDIEKVKFRLRAYGSDNYQTWKAEVKFKQGDLVHKSSRIVCHRQDQLGDVIRCLHSPYNWPVTQTSRVISDYTYLTPVIWVGYERYAYQSIDRQVRITIDSNIGGHAYSGLSVPNVFAQRLETGVLEVKQENYQPDWLGRLKANLRPCRRSFSKYASCVQSMSI